MFFFDPYFFIFIMPALIFVLYAQARVRAAFEQYSRVASSSRMTGREVAREILNAAGLYDVEVERIAGDLGDHYDPRARALRLSERVHDSYSLAALGVAAHEAGHALQHAGGYVFLTVRNSILPVAQFGSTWGIYMFFIGLIIPTFGWLMDLGILLFLAAVIFQVVTLPVEFNASARALALLEGGGFITREEVGPTRAVLNAAAMTYVAATFMAIMQLLRLVMLRDRD